MDYAVAAKPDATEISLAGRMTFDDHEKFLDIIDVLETGDCPAVVFDLSALDFLDSAGMGMLILAKERARRRNLGIALRGARKAVRTSLELARFQNVIRSLD